MKELGDTQISDKINLKNLEMRIQQMKHLYKLMEKTSTKKELASLQTKINETTKLRDDLQREAEHNARVLAHWLIKCMLMADITSQYADAFADVYHQASRKIAPNDNSYSQELRKASDDFYKLVEHINNANNLPMEQYYADMATELATVVTNTIEDFCTKWFNTKQGYKYF